MGFFRKSEEELAKEKEEIKKRNAEEERKARRREGKRKKFRGTVFNPSVEVMSWKCINCGHITMSDSMWKERKCEYCGSKRLLPDVLNIKDQQIEYTKYQGWRDYDD